MARKKKTDLAPSKSLSPEDAQLIPTTHAKRFAWEDPRYGDLENSVYNTFQTAMDDRECKREDLSVFNDLYEMKHDDNQNHPWVGASDIIPPIIPAELESSRDYLIMSVFSPHLFFAKTPITEEQKYGPAFERWLNQILFEERHSGVCWGETLLSMAQASLRDGTTGIMALWEKRERNVPSFGWRQKVDDEGKPLLGDDGKPDKERILETIVETVAEPKVSLVLSKDVYLSPAFSTNFQTAVTGFITLWLTESDLRAMAKGMGDDVKKGTFSAEALEIVFAFNPNGQTDYVTDPEGSDDKDEGGMISAGGGQGTTTSDFFANRGPFEIRLCMSKRYDMNGDGTVEENWFWLHYQTHTMIGWMPYEYLMDQRPVEFFSPFPRVNQFDGYSVPERIVDLMESEAANKNSRQNYDDMVVSPILVHKAGALQRNKNMTVMPGATWEADNPREDFVWLSPPQSTSTSFQEDSKTDSLISKVMGQAAPFTGGQSPTRQTAVQAKQAGAAQGTRSAVIALWFRFFIRRFIAMILSLYRQYADPETFNPPELQGMDKKPYEILMMHFKADVSGLSDPVDAATKRNDMATWAEMIVKLYPARFQSSPEAQYQAAKTYTEQAFPNIANTEGVLGTADDAKKLGEQMAAAQAQAQAQEQAGGKPAPQ